jgi:segregation and condensation protein B
MTDNYIKNVVEAALLAAGRPLQLTELAQLFEEHARPEPTVLRAALEALEADYGSRGIELKETATGYRIQVRKELANEVSRLWPERPPKYSRALLETLALIAYRQPITRGEIEAVRGVAVNPNIIKTVIERNWVRVVGTRDVPGRPELLGTTKDFLDYFGLRALDELPPLAELKAMGEINLQLDLAKPGESGGEGGPEGGSGSDEGSGSSGAGGAGGASGAGGEDSGRTGTSGDGSVAAVGAVAAMGAVAAVGAAVAADTIAEAGNDAVAADDDARSANRDAGTADGDAGTADSNAAVHIGEPVSAEEMELVEVVADAGEGAPAAEAATHLDVSASAEDAANTAATPGAVAEPVTGRGGNEAFVAYEHDPHAATITHVDIESDPGDVTVEVEALTFVEQQLEAEERERAQDTAIETGEFEMSELGMASKPAPIIEAEFDAEDIGGTQSDEDDVADDDEELSAAPQSSTELVAAPPRDRDD